MAENDRRNDPGLDANLSVLGDEGKEPHVARVGNTPRPQEDSNLEEHLAGGEKRSGDGNLDLESQRAAHDSIADVAGRSGKA